MTLPGARIRRLAAPLLAGGAAAALAAALAAAEPGPGGAAPEAGFDAAHWRAAFARPEAVPAPPGNPATPDKVALGRRLFEDVRLSGSNGVACITCHQPDLAFSDGVSRRSGLHGDLLPRRTPPLWNLAWGLTFFWDGRAPSLEEQAAFPIENRHEMGGNLAETARELRADAGMRRAFADAFPGEAEPVTPAAIARALAAYERTLVSPPTRFDRWVKGEDGALGADEMAGLRLFVGKAGCVACHTGWRFTDEAFHDIGLPATAPPDRGRGAVLGLAAADHAFKTPSLRERVWSAPYMHDGSLATLDEVIAHYAAGIVPRPTLSRDLKPALDLSPQERAQLAAFLATLSGEDPPRPLDGMPRAQVAEVGGGTIPEATTLVGQKDRRFRPGAVALRAGEALTVVNDDTRTHTVRIDDPRMAFSSAAQEPGDSVVIPFPEPGQFSLSCGIHPEMRLDVTVAPR